MDISLMGLGDGERLPRRRGVENSVTGLLEGLGEEFSKGIKLDRIRNLAGGRVVLETPVLGLRLGASAYTGDEVGSARLRGIAAQVEYLAGPWSVRSEGTRKTVKGDLKATAF